MRFLLSSASRRARSSAAVAASSSEAVPNKKTNFGQQCGANCGCVARLELVLDGSSNSEPTVQAARYTAKQILLLRSDVKNNNGNDSEQQPQPQPWRTSKGRLQFVESPCRTLHRLLQHTVAFLPGRSLPRLQTYVDFAGHRSTESFGRAVLQQHGLLVEDHDGSNSTARASRTTAATSCFDLVEDVVTAAVRGYLPSPRRRQPSYLAHSDNEYFHYGSNVSNYREEAFPSRLMPHKTDVDDGDDGDWCSKALWPFSSTMTDDHDSGSHGSSNGGGGTSKGNASSNRRWTALDWMDYWELQQEQSDNNNSSSSSERTNLLSSGSGEGDDNQTMVKDWLSYVDKRAEEEDHQSA